MDAHLQDVQAMIQNFPTWQWPNIALDAVKVSLTFSKVCYFKSAVHWLMLLVANCASWRMSPIVVCITRVCRVLKLCVPGNKNKLDSAH